MCSVTVSPSPQTKVEWVGQPWKVEGYRKYYSQVLINKEEVSRECVTTSPCLTCPSLSPPGVCWRHSVSLSRD